MSPESPEQRFESLFWGKMLVHLKLKLPELVAAEKAATYTANR
jgi:hypothetical protein